MGRLAEAEQAFRGASALYRDYADAHSNLGVTLHDLGRLQEALPAFERALLIRPDHPDALFNAGNLLRDLGREQEAERNYRKALELRPNRAEAHNNLGNSLLAQQRPAEAAACYRKALALAPGYAEAWLNLGTALAAQEMIEEAAQCFHEAARLRPDKPLWRLRSLGLCPAVFSSVEEMDRFRWKAEAQLDAARKTSHFLQAESLANDTFTPSFYFSHHGRNNRPLKEKFAAIIEPHFPQSSQPIRSTVKPRIGFLVTQRHEGGFLRALSGIIERLDATRFQPVVLCSEPVLGTCRRNIHRVDVEFVGFPSRFDLACEQITASRCDLLYHWQIGTDALNYLLPFARLAPVQCAGWGTHATSGIRAVDYYLSSKLVEPNGAEDHYTETLHRFETFPTWQHRIPAAPKAERGHFGLPEQGNLYLAPHRPAKFHPDFDPLLAGVLDANPDGWLVVLQGKHEHPAAQLRERWERTLGRALDRVVFLPTQAATDYRRLLAVSDVMLDAPHYGAGFMVYDAVAQNLPIVTLPGAFNVGRWTLGCYRRMEVDDLIAQTSEQYIAQAVRVGRDRDYRQWLRSLLAQRGEVLFEDRQSVEGHERFFDMALCL